MNFNHAICRALHEEHMATLDLLGRLEQHLNGHSITTPPDALQAETHRLLGTLKAAINSEVTSHFAFEEEAIFPRLAEAGADDMNAILADEHKVLLPLGKRIAEMAEAAGRDGFTIESWEAFTHASHEFIDGLRAHVDKEEMGMIPALDDILTEQDDDSLIQAYKFDH